MEMTFTLGRISLNVSLSRGSAVADVRLSQKRQLGNPEPASALPPQTDIANAQPGSAKGHFQTHAPQQE
ncbi:hypothetical protein ACVIIV_005486 [Bradyrhizobium sp. USDA 4354]